MESEGETEDFDLVIIPPEPDALSDEDEIDESVVALQVQDTGVDFDGNGTPDIPGTIQAMSSSTTDKTQAKKAANPKWRKGKPVYKSKPTSSPSLSTKQNVIDELDGIEALDLFDKMAAAIVTKITEETNRYARQKNAPDFLMTEKEIKIFLGILLFSGYHKLPRQHMYWETAADCNTEIIRKAMSKNKFKKIKKYLHFNDNDQIDNSDRYFKVRPLFDLLNETLLQFGIFEEQLTIDERMVKYFGRHGMKMYMKGKPVKFGYKIWVLSSFNGFPFYFLPYQPGQQGDSLLSSFVVEKLMGVVENPQCHPVYMDNFFTSYSLASLLQEKKIFFTGTIREQRIKNCPIASTKIMKKKGRGYSESRFDEVTESAVVRWNDNRVVTVITNFENVSSSSEVTRRSAGGPINCAIPEAIKSYNKYKNGVDLFDGLMAPYEIAIQGKKWYWPLFTNCINALVVSTWRLRKILKLENEDLLSFHRKVTLHLLSGPPKVHSRMEIQRRVWGGSAFVKANSHVLIKNAGKKQRRCKVCPRKPTTSCLQCNIGLCAEPCFSAYHC